MNRNNRKNVIFLDGCGGWDITSARVLIFSPPKPSSAKPTNTAEKSLMGTGNTFHHNNHLHSACMAFTAPKGSPEHINLRWNPCDNKTLCSCNLSAPAGIQIPEFFSASNSLACFPGEKQLDYLIKIHGSPSGPSDSRPVMFSWRLTFRSVNSI